MFPSKELELWFFALRGRYKYSMDHPEPEQKNKRRALGLKHAQEIAKEVVRPPDALRMEKKLLQSGTNEIK